MIDYKYITVKPNNNTYKDNKGKIRRSAFVTCICGKSFTVQRVDQLTELKNCGCIPVVYKKRKKTKKKPLTEKQLYTIKKNEWIKEYKKLKKIEIKRQRSHKLKYTWENMLRRCNSKVNHKYSLYGAKGVTVCKEWANDYFSFYDWALCNGYKEGLQLDKDIKCDKMGIYPKVYGPNTCMFVTPKQNIHAKYQRYNS